MKLIKVNLGARSKFAVISALLVPCGVIDFTVLRGGNPFQCYTSCDLEVTNESTR